MLWSKLEDCVWLEAQISERCVCNLRLKSCGILTSEEEFGSEEMLPSPSFNLSPSLSYLQHGDKQYIILVALLWTTFSPTCR